MYGKLFTSMYDGTLAAGGNWQALVTFQQLIILCDHKGVIDMTAEAISRRTSIPIEIINRGLIDLMKPDPNSRTPGHDGKRIIFLDEHRPWGWAIVNHSVYRNIKSQDERRDYHRQYYAQKRAVGALDEDTQHSLNKLNTLNVNSSNSNHTDTDTDTYNTIAHAPAKMNGNSRAFQVFWDSYPKKKNKGDAERAWKSAKITDTLSVKLLSAVEAAKRGKDWCKEDGKYIPYPASWIRSKGWEDEIAAPKQKRLVI